MSITILLLTFSIYAATVYSRILERRRPITAEHLQSRASGLKLDCDRAVRCLDKRRKVLQRSQAACAKSTGELARSTALLERCLAAHGVGI